MELPEKAEAALVAYLQGFETDDAPPKTWPPSMTAGEQVRIFPGENDQEKDGQCVLAIADDATEESPPFSGNEYIPVRVVLRTPVKKLDPKEKADKVPEPPATHSAAAAVLEQALGGDPFVLAAAITEEVDDFCVMGGVLDRRPTRSQTDKYWESGFEFRLYCMGRDG
jgi:hypothetical protein